MCTTAEALKGRPFICRIPTTPICVLLMQGGFRYFFLLPFVFMDIELSR